MKKINELRGQSDGSVRAKWESVRGVLACDAKGQRSDIYYCYLCDGWV